MRALVLVLSTMLAACAAPQPQTPALPHDEGATMDVAAYNRAMASQGISHHCSDKACDTLPVLLFGRVPAYPESLRASRVNGDAVIVFVIDVDGSVVDMEVRSATHPEFSEVAMKALKSWRFRPATLNGQPVRRSAVQQFPFNVESL
jgi:TonB family protein